MPRLPVGQQLVIPEDVMDGVDKWMRCLVGFFPGSKMPYQAINNMAMRVWRAKGLESVATTANGFILFRFKNQANLQGQIKILPVWIRLKGLPLPLWTTKGLSLVASMVGKPLSCDEATHKCSRLEYARICVEIDADMAYVHKFEVVTPLST
ncbi:GLYCINE-RICH CELL WALL STRUCTURAL PROTEIN 1.8-LIKE [Salix viminalis]|uniref:GLYCINE-RICH CELL WALL STRUCTURAL PROTEIN 1.8-LIKE n=1 Tax=Salix viminalis TaxID=40686 RepID=A0A9Q0V6Z7_SALVM|nr:GLYCINE-RICH CELL WALL STRUCTURAL PROTEIN 1.8-LIKE [Salix viminalis]